jgi:glyoxylase-like metal-dependent hydrolase (beta-lactamase superfamily II)
VDVGLDQAYADEANPYIIQRLNDDTRGELKIDIDPPDALMELGVSPDDVDYVIISHCHLDHIACVPRFTAPTFVTSRYGLEWTMNPPYPDIVDPIATPRKVVEFLYEESQKPGGRVILTDDDATPLPGIRTVRTGGHSMDSQIIFVETEKGTVGLGVDNVITYEHLENHIAPGSPVNLLDALRAMELLEKEADIIIPGHAPDFYERYPDGIIV